MFLSDDNDGYETDESEDIVFVDYILNKYGEKRDKSETNKGIHTYEL